MALVQHLLDGIEQRCALGHLVHDAEKAAAARTGDSIGAHLAPQDAEAA